ncbi:MAG: class I SAM-dependent methyltransferase [bacterium]
MKDLRPAARRAELFFFRSKLSRLFAELMSRKARHLYQLVVDDVGPIEDGGVIADIGCGHGTFLLMYLSQYPRVEGFGLDQSAELCAFARNQCERGKVKAAFAAGDAHVAPLPEQAFDVVVSTSSIYLWHDPVLVLNRIYSALKPGGRLLLYDELPARKLGEIWSALAEQRLYGLGLPAYTEKELLDFANHSHFESVVVDIDKLIIRLTLEKKNPDA